MYSIYESVYIGDGQGLGQGMGQGERQGERQAAVIGVARRLLTQSITFALRDVFVSPVKLIIYIILWPGFKEVMCSYATVSSRSINKRVLVK